MPWKKNEDGTLAIQDDAPVWTFEDGKDVVVKDHGESIKKVESANTESAARRRELREAQDKLKVIEGIEDVPSFLQEAKKAIELVQNLDDKKLVDAGKVDALKTQLAEAYTAKEKELNTTITGLQSQLYTAMVGQNFSTSEFIKDKTVSHPSLLEAYFKDNFKIEDGKVVGMLNGNPIQSREKVGEPAGFDEALSLMVEASPLKDSILKADHPGSGTPPGGDGKLPGSKKRSEMTTKEKANFAATHGQDAFMKLPA